MKLSWNEPTTWDDNVTPFGQVDFKGWTLSIDDAPAVSIPTGWDAAGPGKGSFDLAALNLSGAPHKVVMFTVAANGQTSAPSGVLMTPNMMKPLPPLALSVA